MRKLLLEVVDSRAFWKSYWGYFLFSYGRTGRMNDASKVILFGGQWQEVNGILVLYRVFNPKGNACWIWGLLQPTDSSWCHKGYMLIGFVDVEASARSHEWGMRVLMRSHEWGITPAPKISQIYSKFVACCMMFPLFISVIFIFNPNTNTSSAHVLVLYTKCPYSCAVMTNSLDT